MVRSAAFVLLALLIVPLRAQDVPLAPFSEIESLRIEVIRLEGLVLQQEIATWNAKRAALKADLEAARHGFTYDLDTGKWTRKEATK